MLEKKLGEISAIPSKLDILINRIEQSNITLASNVKNTMNQTVQGLLAGFSKTSGSSARNYVTPILPSWMKWTIIVSVILIAIACISNTAYNI